MFDHDTEPQVFSIRPHDSEGTLGRALSAASPALDLALGLAHLQRYYEQRPPGCDARTFLSWSLDVLHIDVRARKEDLQQVPESGPTVVVANHPFGGVEGLILPKLLLYRRDDVRVMANYMLGRIPEIRELFLLVDPFDTARSLRNNLSAMREALAWLRAGGLLIVFPAGEVAHLRPSTRRIEDPEWNPAVAGLIRRTDSQAVPVFFSGRNSLLFQIAGLMHPRVRTAMLARQLLRLRGRSVDVHFGSPIVPKRLAAASDNAEAVAYLRGRTEILAERPSLSDEGRSPVQPRATPSTALPLVPAVASDLLAAEIDALPADALVLDGDDQVVYVAEPQRIPNVLREIGRLRELTFREVGEGTGREVDLDHFDSKYLHLFIWSRADRAVVGAYRIGRTDLLLNAGGLPSLYTSTLFDYKPELFENMGPSLEMGRSFVRPEYQRSYAPLMLLWKGIGHFVLRDPRYGTLWGPVSISADYRSASQRMLVAFLEQNRYAHEWSTWVHPRTPHRPDRRTTRQLRPLQLCDLDDVSTFISEIEADHKGVPILLKQYLKLGGRLLGFNVDPAFANVLDVLIMVDLRQTTPRILGRYMGREGAARFFAFHREARVS